MTISTTAFEKAELLPERLAEWLRDEIASGRVKPGERLVEMTLAKQCDVSRVPLREAMRIVAADGLITLAPHRGATVNPMSDTELAELFGLRAALEGFSAGEAARRRVPEDLARLQSLMDEMQAAVAEAELDAYPALAAHFHGALVAAGGNSLLAEAYDRVKIRFRRYQSAMSRLPDLPANSMCEHAAILDAVRAGDREAARRLAESHIRSLVDRFVHTAG